MQMIPRTRWMMVLVTLAAVLPAAPTSSARAEGNRKLAKGPVKVFLLAGQSNMDGQADVRTIDFLGEDADPARAALLKVFKPVGKDFIARDDVWVANASVYDELQPGFGGRRHYEKLGSCIGPEYAFGYYMGAHYPQQVLLIKYAPGGQSLYVNFRPPSAGKTGNPKLPVVVGVMGVNGVLNEVGKQKEVRDGQRFVNTVSEFLGNVKAVETAPLLDPRIVAIQTAGWLNKDRDLKKQPLTDAEKAMLRRATSNKGFHYYGSGRFMILVGKLFADTMLELMGK